MNSLNMLRRVVQYRATRMGLSKPPAPINLTLSVTNMCQSRCKTCSIWNLYQHEPEKFKTELSVGEIDQTFAGIGHVHFFNISGGEPFLRRDLPDIVRSAVKHLTPAVIHTPTNALMPKIIEERCEQILSIINESGREIPFTIKPSFDGVGEKHDEIRGVKGNYDKVLDTLSRLKKLQERHPNLEVGLGTIISKFNLDSLRETAQCARELGVDSYISEIAEERTELFNVGNGITPSPEEYEKAIEIFTSELDKGSFPGRRVSATTLAFRKAYYQYAVQTMKQRRQVLPCYAGIANVHINPYGDVWPCCILGYGKSMGNLREAGYDFYSIWHSAQAAKVRKSIARGECHCPLANQAYSNILCSPGAVLQVVRHLCSAKKA